ncbi:MAG: universal stress protein [Candidatus Dormibacteraeota bacterium]|nr:universal stress protein [Candidatus Dormibacteraeota bacterium]
MIIRIVVGSDGTAEGQNAVLFAAELARQLHAEVLLVHAIGTTDLDVLAADGSAPSPNGDAEPREPESIADRVRTLWAKPLIETGVAWGAEVRLGPPAQVLATIADEVGAQLVVIGGGAPDGTDGWPLGDIGGVLAHPRAVPLIVVPRTKSQSHAGS